jgi:hypothetical protein
LTYNLTLDSCDRNGKGQQNLWEGRIKFEYFCNEVAWIKYFCNIKRIKEAWRKIKEEGKKESIKTNEIGGPRGHMEPSAAG